MTPMRIPGISFIRRVTVALIFFRTWVRHGYMLPVVSKLKTTSMALSIMDGPLFWRSRDREGSGGLRGHGSRQVMDKMIPIQMLHFKHPHGYARTLIVHFSRT